MLKTIVFQREKLFPHNESHCTGLLNSRHKAKDEREKNQDSKENNYFAVALTPNSCSVTSEASLCQMCKYGQRDLHGPTSASPLF